MHLIKILIMIKEKFELNEIEFSFPHHLIINCTFVAYLWSLILHFVHLRILPADCTLGAVKVLAELVTNAAGISRIPVAALF